MSESKDRAALRAIVNAEWTTVTLQGMTQQHRARLEAARAALAQPDPAEQLAEALRDCMNSLVRITAKWEEEPHSAEKARAALAAYEGK